VASPVQIDFGGEERNFLCRIGELRKIEEKCGVGVFEIAGSLGRVVQVLREKPNATLFEQVIYMAGTKADFIREPIYQCLVAGGMPSGEATMLVRQEVDEQGFVGLVQSASVALVALIAGVSIPDKEKSEGELAGAPKAPKDSTSGKSTETGARSAGRRSKSTAKASGSSAKP
jgi:hypothetical protein